MTPDKRLLYNTHKYMLQSLPSLPAMPAFPTAAFHPSLLQSACTNLSSRTELQISWCCCCVFSPPWEAASPLHGSEHMCGCGRGSDTEIVVLPVGRWLSIWASWSSKSHREARDMLRSQSLALQDRHRSPGRRRG